MMNTLTGKVNTRRIMPTLLWWAMVTTTVAVSAYTHWRAGFTLPPPWNDEPWFLWTSVELCEHGGWASPSLRPGAGLVLSPLYALVHAGLFKVFGVELGVARWFSWVCMMGAFAGILRMLRNVPRQLAMVACACVFALGVSSVVAGNMGRPEAMLWMLTVWGCALAGEGKTGWGLLLSSLGLNLHLLGYVFFAGILCLSAVQWFWRWREGARFLRGEKAALCVAFAIAAGMVILGFLCFDANSFHAAASEDTSTLWRRLETSYRWWWILAGGAIWSWQAFHGGRGMGMSTLGLLGMAPLVLRSQMWYAVYEQQGYGALVIAVFCFLFDLSRGRGGWMWRTAAWAALAGMAVFAYRFAFVTGPRGYPGKLEWGWGMTVEEKPPAYLTEEDKAAVLSELERCTAGKERPLRVMFVPEGDGLFYHGSLPEGLIPYMGVRTEVPGDVLVFRHTRHMPEWASKQHWSKACARYAVENAVPFRERDGSEWWLFGELRPDGETGEEAQGMEGSSR